jgi:hypothetical protein
MCSKTIYKYSYILIAIALNILFFYPAIFLNKTFFFRDIHRWFYPMKYFLATSLKTGEIPFWCSNYFCGSPFMSDIQSGVFYPLSVIFLIFPFPMSFNIYVVAHFFLGFCFFYLFIISLGLSRKSALLTSISYCYGGYVLATMNTLNNLSTVIWLPAILWSFNRAAIRQQKSGYFLTILFLSMAILGGEPQLFILIVGALFFYAITCQRESGPVRTRWAKYGMYVIFMVISAILVTMVQLGPTFVDYQNSARLGGLSYGEASKFSLDLLMLKHLFLPLHFHQGFATDPATLKDFFPGGDVPWLLTVYPGVIIAPLALIGIIFSFSRKTLIWTTLFIVSTILALGENTPAHYLLYDFFPFFRYPSKFMFLAGFSILILAAYGFDRLRPIHRQCGQKSTILFLCLTFALVMDLYSNHRNLNPVCDSEFYQYHHPALQPILDDPGTFRIFVDKIHSPPDLQNAIHNIQIRWQTVLLPNLGLLRNLDHVSGVTALELIYQYQIMKILSKPWQERMRFLRLANVKYIISQERLDINLDLKGKVEKVNFLVYRIRDYLPRAWLIGQLHQIKKGTIKDLLNGSFNPVCSALELGRKQKQYDNPFFKKVEHISYEKDDSIHIETETDKPAILVVSESFYPGWKVYVDGHEKERLRLDLLFQGVEIGPGKHDIIFKFRPKYFNLFLCISLVSLVLLISFWLRFAAKHRFKP